MEGTTANEVFDSFDSSFRDKEIIPDGLKLVWLKKAVARYSTELETLEFNEEEMSLIQSLTSMLLIHLRLL